MDKQKLIDLIDLWSDGSSSISLCEQLRMYFDIEIRTMLLTELLKKDYYERFGKRIE